jgi:hypothetical protein
VQIASKTTEISNGAVLREYKTYLALYTMLVSAHYIAGHLSLQVSQSPVAF